VLIPVLILLLAGCGGHDEQEASQLPKAAPSASTPAASTAPAAAIAAPIVVRNADNSELMSVSMTGGVVEIALTEAGQKHTLRGEPRDTGKRKYSVDGGAVQYEVKPGDDQGFKLRTAEGGKLLWKVKVTSEKIKISNNEENENPFELKVRDGDRVKVVAPGDRELGTVRFDRAKSTTEIENAGGVTQFRVDGSTPSGSYGVLLLTDIPMNERAILLAEILSRGR
jgi:hypothetical protein